MLSTKTKEHIRRRAALGLPRWGTLLVSLGALAGCVAFTGSQLHVVKITDTHGAQGMAITSAHDIKTLMQQRTPTTVNSSTFCALTPCPSRWTAVCRRLW